MSRRKVRGPAGAVAHFDVPSPGMSQETFDQWVRDGRLVELDDSGDTGTVSETEPETKRKPGRPPKQQPNEPAEGDSQA